jgi:integrase
MSTRIIFLFILTRPKIPDLKEIRVPMNTILRAVLKKLKETKNPKDEYVFVNPRTGKAYDYRDKFLPNLCSEAGVKPFMYHALRHYGASKLDSMGGGADHYSGLLGK